MTRLYFDNNIYDMVCKLDQTEEVAAFLRSSHHKVTASATNILELYAIRNYELRKKQMKTLACVATGYEEVPESFRQAKEVLGEVRRLRPQWLHRRRALARPVRGYLATHRHLWR